MLRRLGSGLRAGFHLRLAALEIVAQRRPQALAAPGIAGFAASTRHGRQGIEGQRATGKLVVRF